MNDLTPGNLLMFPDDENVYIFNSVFTENGEQFGIMTIMGKDIVVNAPLSDIIECGEHVGSIFICQMAPLGAGLYVAKRLRGV